LAHLGWIEVHRVIAREHVGETINKTQAEQYAKTLASNGNTFPSEKIGANVGFGWYCGGSVDNAKRPVLAIKAGVNQFRILPESEWREPNGVARRLVSSDRNKQDDSLHSRVATATQSTTQGQVPTAVIPSAFPFNDRTTILSLADRYWNLISSSEATEERVFEQELASARKQGFLNKALFVRLARWKSVRQTPNYESNNEDSIKVATARAFSASDERTPILALTQLRGIALRTASALLHWMRPDLYPILDFRVVGALGKPEPASYEDIGFYLRIAKEIRVLAGRHGLDLRTMDRALWAWQKLQARTACSK